MSPPSTEQLLKIFDIGDVNDTAAAPAKLQLDEAPAADDDEIKPPEPFEIPLRFDVIDDRPRRHDGPPFIPLKNRLEMALPGLGKRWGQPGAGRRWPTLHRDSSPANDDGSAKRVLFEGKSSRRTLVIGNKSYIVYDYTSDTNK